MKNSIIYTLGTGTRAIQDFLEIIKNRRIEVIVDVRRFPTSRFEHFKKENLAKSSNNYGIEYLYMGDKLGGYRKCGYESYTQTEKFKTGVERLKSLSVTKTICIVCAETLPWKCHRRFIGKSLSDEGYEVIHIIDEKHEWKPKF